MSMGYQCLSLRSDDHPKCALRIGLIDGADTCGLVLGDELFRSALFQSFG